MGHYFSLSDTTNIGWIKRPIPAKSNFNLLSKSEYEGIGGGQTIMNFHNCNVQICNSDECKEVKIKRKLVRILESDSSQE